MKKGTGMSAFNDRYNLLLNKARQAMRCGHCAWAVQSTGEKIAVALVLNRADWLEELGYTLAEAVERIGQDWVAVITQVAHQLAKEGV